MRHFITLFTIALVTIILPISSAHAGAPMSTSCCCEKKCEGKQCPMQAAKECCCKKSCDKKQCPMHTGGECCCKGMKQSKQCPLSMIEVQSASEIKRNPAVKAYEKAFHRMHEGMVIFYTGDADTDFARGMIPHHQGAIDMAKVVLEYGKDEDVKRLAEWIIYIQEIEIARMKHWLTRVGATQAEKAPGYDANAVSAYEKAMEKMHHEMNIVYTGDADVDFVLGMIPHHQGAVEMALVQFKHGKNFEMNELADDVVRTQNGEIAHMRAWLEDKGITCTKSLQEQILAKRGVKKSKGKMHHKPHH